MKNDFLAALAFTSIAVIGSIIIEILWFLSGLF